LTPVPDLKNSDNGARVDFRSAATSGRQYSAQAIFNSKLGATIHLKKHPEDDYFIIHLKKVLLAWIFNANINYKWPQRFQAMLNRKPRGTVIIGHAIEKIFNQCTR